MRIISRLGSHTVKRLQFALGSDWEHCLIVNDGTDNQQVNAWFARAAERQIAAELFFDAPEDGLQDAFAGVRTEVSASVAEFYRNTAQKLASGTHGSVADFFESALFELSFESEDVEFMELGAVNLWNSFGPLRFWRPGSGEPRQALLAALADGGRYLEPMSVPAAIELSFRGAPQSWLGLPVSEKQRDGSYILPLEKALNAAILFMPVK